MKNQDQAVAKSAAALPLAGLWMLVDDRLIEIERWDVGSATVVVPTEAVLLLAVDLPLAGRSARLAALPFAIEDRIADPLDAVHVALGAEIAPRTFLAGAVRHVTMANWLEVLEQSGLGHAAIVPDAMLLPIPPSGSWNIEMVAARMLVRTDNGSGFAVPVDRFSAIWAAGGSLPCVVTGAPLPFDLPMSTVSPAGSEAGSTSRRLLQPGLDLRQGRYAAAARPLPAALRRLGVIIVAGLLAHTAIAAADTLELRRVASQRRTATEALVRQVLPGMPITADLERMLPDTIAAHGRFLPLLARASTVLGPVGGLTLNKLTYADSDGTLTLGIEAADIGGLQRAQAALLTAGLNPVSGAATAAAGRADGDIVVRGNPA